ncbi:hypothetical protein SSX86_020299 [Deinandra increscens subsp. villosa]|uniref:UBC core domain-containing protein n=1 Tax=Deinandra increscens subsp. villosa TaxID=3103831 RepID=A0AAP0GUJ0_9ASTR
MAKRNPKRMKILDPSRNQGSSFGSRRRSARLNNTPPTFLDSEKGLSEKRKSVFKNLEPGPVAATFKSKQLNSHMIVLYDDDDGMDENLDAEVDKLCKVIMDYIFPAAWPPINDDNKLYTIQKSPPDAQVNCSRFLAFSKQYKPKFDKFMERYSRVGKYPKKDVLLNKPDGTGPLSSHDDESVLKAYKEFKRFDVVEDHSDHLFSIPPIQQASETTSWWADRVQDTWKDLKENLPETIFVRAYEGRMDLLRAVIIGRKETPYQDGLFFFDMFLPRSYPLQAPVVRYHSGGFGINPYLFECGEVSLTASRKHYSHFSSLWPSWETTMVGFLVSLKDRVLNADPLFHQPVSLKFGPSVVAEYFSLLYNEDILIKSLKTMMLIMNKPPKHFEAFVVGHFRSHMTDILVACRAYKNGLQVGGGVGKKVSCCSIEFRNNVDLCIWQLACCFDGKVGVNKADLLLALTGPIPSEMQPNSSTQVTGSIGL